MGELSRELMINKTVEEEGYSSKLYKCTAGKWTGGTGINVEAQDMPHEAICLWQEERPDLKILGNTGIMHGVLMMEHGLPANVWEVWLERILSRLTSRVADKLYDEYDLSFGDLPEDCQIVIIDCCYQMGLNGFFAFKKTLAHIKNLDYVDASLELLNSKYAREDTPARAQRNAKLLMDCGCKL